jgi:hypothetical protein
MQIRNCHINKKQPERMQFILEEMNNFFSNQLPEFIKISKPFKKFVEDQILLEFLIDRYGEDYLFEGYPLIVYALIFDSLPAVKLLISKKANCLWDGGDPFLEPILIPLYITKNFLLTNILIENYQYELRKYLQFAIFCDQSDIVEFFLKKGIPDLNFNDHNISEDETLFHYAVRGLNLDIITLFYDYGADIHAMNITNSTALFMTEEIPILKFLIEVGLDINHQNAIERNPIVFWCSELKEKKDKLSEILALFVQHGADPTIKDYQGHDAFHYIKWNDMKEKLKRYSDAHFP